MRDGRAKGEGGKAKGYSAWTVPPRLDHPHAVGLDVGGTKIAGGVVDLATGAVLSRRVIPTGAARGGEAVLADALALASGLRDEARARGIAVVGVGVGVPELVDPHGDMRSAHAVAWKGVPVRERFADVAPSVVESDVRAAALGEALYGAGRGYALFAYLTVGTGISSCLVLDGRPLPGARGNALVIGSSPLSSICDACGKESHVVLEDVASGPALVARLNARAPRRAASGEDVLAAASAGDPASVEVVRSAGYALGNSVAFLVNVADPEAVVVGGGLGHAEGLYRESFVASLREHIWAEETRGLPILSAALGPDAGLVGAAASVGAKQCFAPTRAAPAPDPQATGGVR